MLLRSNFRMEENSIKCEGIDCQNHTLTPSHILPLSVHGASYHRFALKETQRTVLASISIQNNTVIQLN